MSNLTLVTVGVAFKNFITRTSAASRDVDAMLNREDSRAIDKNGILELLKAAKKLAKKFWCDLLYNLLSQVWRLGHRCCNWKPDTANVATDDEDDFEAKLDVATTDEATKQNARSIKRVHAISTFLLSFVTWWYIFTIVVGIYVSPWGLIMAVTLVFVVYLTLLPLLRFIANTLKNGSDGQHRRKIDACINVVEGMIVLRSTLIICQTMMHRSIAGWYMADRIMWESYWANGEASEKLMDMLSFRLTDLFDFEINPTPKILSFVVLAIEVVAAIGSNLQQTAVIRLFQRGCCQWFCFHVSTFAAKQSILAKKVGTVADQTDDINIESLTALLDDPRRALDDMLTGSDSVAMAEEVGRLAAVSKLKPKLEPSVKALGLTWDDVKPALESFDFVSMKKAITDPTSFLEEVAAPIAKKLAISKLRAKLDAVLREHGVEWDSISATLNEMSLKDIKEALMDPAPLIEQLVANVARPPETDEQTSKVSGSTASTTSRTSTSLRVSQPISRHCTHTLPNSLTNLTVHEPLWNRKWLAPRLAMQLTKCTRMKPLKSLRTVFLMLRLMLHHWHRGCLPSPTFDAAPLASRMLAIAQMLKPTLEPYLTERGTSWDQFSSHLQHMTATVMKEAMNDPIAYADKILSIKATSSRDMRV